MLFLTVLLCLLNYNFGAIVRLNETEYARMPALVHFDPYEECLQNPDAVYCYAHFELISDTQSPLLDMIKAYSDHYYSHFNHTILRYGVCITDTCKHINGTHKDQKQDLEACLNETLWKSHRLKTKLTTVSYCNVHKRKLETSIWDTITFSVLVAIILINIAGSLYHYLDGNQEKNKVTKILLAFSLQRNWKRFITIVPHTEPRLAQLQSMHGMRGIMCIIVIMVHAGMPHNFLLTENPDFVEKMYDRVVDQIFINGPLLMQGFFMMSSCLMIQNFLIYEEYKGKKLTWSSAPMLIFMRLLRVTPPYAVILAISATLVRYAPKGPIFQHVLGNNSEDCRKYWWRHLLYINNYFEDSECMPHTWYLGADTQLYCFGVLVFVACKTPRVRKWVLSILFAAGLIIPALHTYFQDLDATLIVDPESIVNSFKDNAHYNELYKRGHTNLAACTIGIIVGYLIYDWQNKGVNGQDFYKYRYLYRLVWVLTVCVEYAGSIFYEDRPADPLYIKLLWASLLKPLFSITGAIAVLGTVFRVENVFSSVLGWRPWIYVSRLSYGAYLIHMMYVRVSSGGITHTVYVTRATLLYVFFKTVAYTFALALVFWLLVEAPAKNLIEEYMKPAPKSKKEVCGETEDKLNAAEVSGITKKNE